MVSTGAATLSDHAHAALAQADATRVHLGHKALEPEHILAGLLDVPEGNGALILRHLHVNLDELRRELDLFLRRAVALPSGDSVPLDGRDVPLGFSGRSVLDRTAALAGDGPIGTEHLLRAVQTLPSPAATLLRTFGVTAEEVERRFTSEESGGDRGPAVDLVERGRRGLLPPLVERPMLLREVIIRLLSSGVRAVLLVGEPGSGRTSVVYLLARALAALPGVSRRDGSGAGPLGEDRLSTDLGSPAASLPDRLIQAGEQALFANPVEAFRAAARAAHSSILWVPDIHMYFGASPRPADVDAGIVLREVIASGDVTVLGSSTPEAQRRHFAAEAAMFESVFVPEPGADEVLAIVRAAAPRLAEEHQVTIAEDALTATADLAQRYGRFTGTALPGSALRVLERACVEVQLAGVAGLGFTGESDGTTVDAADVAVAVSALTGVTVRRVGAEEAARLATIEEHLRQRVIGQDEALSAMARAVRRARMGFKDPKRPVGSFLFLGGSGVGKTESARALAEFLFGDESEMIRLDMSEYADKHTVARMIGAPPGYVGYEEGGQLTEAVRRRPESLVLFDEVEKAHPDVLTILLQIVEDGRLTDGKGRTVDFRQCVIIMTSNVGTQLLSGVRGPVEAEAKDLLQAELRRHFRVEFLNRIDSIISFRFLAPEDLARILDMMLVKAGERAGERGITLSFTPAAKAWLLAQHHEPELEARPLRRIVQDYVEDALVERLLRDEVHSGDAVRVDTGVDRLTFVAAGAGAMPFAAADFPGDNGAAQPV